MLRHLGGFWGFGQWPQPGPWRGQLCLFVCCSLSLFLSLSLPPPLSPSLSLSLSLPPSPFHAVSKTESSYAKGHTHAPAHSHALQHTRLHHARGGILASHLHHKPDLSTRASCKAILGTDATHMWTHTCGRTHARARCHTFSIIHIVAVPRGKQRAEWSSCVSAEEPFYLEGGFSKSTSRHLSWELMKVSSHSFR